MVMLKKKGFEINKKNQKIIKQLRKTKIIVNSCRGCLYGNRTFKELFRKDL
jgi:hypothetical protein